MDHLLLLGDEAIAQAGIDSGMSGIYAYPGTPSTEITEYVQSSKDALEKLIKCKWSCNEKTAYEAALGMSYAGKRAMVCMKHVGLNVAADPFINSAITGVNGGLIVVAADDPSMHSSQNEQDSRFYGNFAMIPILEPSNQQEAYDFVFQSFDLSEKLKVPVMLRITTRLAHSRSGIVRQTTRSQNQSKLPDDLSQFVLLPSLARIRYKKLLALQEPLKLESSGNNILFPGNDKKLGIVACGLAFNYYLENKVRYNLEFPVLKINQYPLSDELFRRLADETNELLVLEEGYPFVENQLRGLLKGPLIIKGRLDGTLPRDGELNPDLVGIALGINNPIHFQVPDVVVPRPPSFCKGCSHADMFRALNDCINKYGKGRVFSDIGCYTLGALEPFNSINSCVDMGASVSMAKGAADAGIHPVVAVIGDSTFAHSGITGLLDLVNEKTPVTVIISDNKTTGMTGGQVSSANDRIFGICMGLGVERDHIVNLIPLPKNHSENVRLIQEELEYKGVSVIISERECIQTLKKHHHHLNKE